MRISDWSSDVCSSDLKLVNSLAPLKPEREESLLINEPIAAGATQMSTSFPRIIGGIDNIAIKSSVSVIVIGGRAIAPRPAIRSEEHTSELQSLMRISYAVFCLKQKKQDTKQQTPDMST